MSASELQRAEWLEAGLWERLERLERRLQRAQWDHRLAQRALQALPRGESQALYLAWLRYSAVIAELDRVTAAIESLRGCTSRTASLVP